MERPGPTLPLDNEGLARRLEEIAGLLEAEEANPFRVRAYRRAAATVRGQPIPIHALLAQRGLEGLTELSGIGASLARAIESLVHTDHLALLDRLRGEAGSVDVFTTVFGLGPELARRIHEELGIESLAELEAAAHDGRLAQVRGLGARRVRNVREALAGRFARRAGPAARRPPVRDEPPAAELLDVDREYREKAGRRTLPLIAPRRFNPTREAWLPMLHTARGERHYTALFSNTARAHELGTIRDWVVIYRDDPGGDGQWTVVTARLGALSGRRIVRGREAECARHYAREGQAKQG
jgi:hypothetical protein